MIRRGQDHGRARLTEKQVHQIRHYIHLGYSYAAIAKEYGVSKSAISKIASYENWGWLEQREAEW